MLKAFINEEDGQGGLEYILLIGGMMMASVILFSIYRSMAENSAQRMSESSDMATVTASSRVSAELALL